MGDTKQNPKHIRAMKEGKAPLEYLIPAAQAGEARVLQGGAKKYGRRNWTIDEILATTYIASMRRHIDEWAEGSDTDADSGEHPLCHVRAACGIVIDATEKGTMVDDRLFAESIDQEKGEDIVLAQGVPSRGVQLDPEWLFHKAFRASITVPGCMYTVRYKDKDPHDRLFAPALCFGPFATHEAACNFIKSRDRDVSVTVTIDKINTP